MISQWPSAKQAMETGEVILNIGPGCSTQLLVLMSVKYIFLRLMLDNLHQNKFMNKLVSTFNRRMTKTPKRTSVPLHQELKKIDNLISLFNENMNVPISMLKL